MINAVPGYYYSNGLESAISLIPASRQGTGFFVLQCGRNYGECVWELYACCEYLITSKILAST